MSQVGALPTAAYRVYLHRNSSGRAAEVELLGTTPSANFTARSLRPNATFRFSVRAQNAAGAGDACSTLVTHTAPSAPLLAFVEGASGSESVRLRFVAVGSDDPVVGYHLYMARPPAPDPFASWSVQRALLNATG